MTTSAMPRLRRLLLGACALAASFAAPASAEAYRLQAGDVVEFTLHGDRRTAEAMLVTDGYVLLDLFDGDRPAFARLEMLDDLTVFRPDLDEVIPAA